VADGSGRPNDQMLTRPACQTPVTNWVRWFFAIMSKHACCGDDRLGEAPFVQVTVEVTPAPKKRPVIGRSAISLSRFAWLDGAFQASKHDRSDGRLGDAAVAEPAQRPASAVTAHKHARTERG
jgi:hypothetical protein